MGCQIQRRPPVTFLKAEEYYDLLSPSIAKRREELSAISALRLAMEGYTQS